MEGIKMLCQYQISPVSLCSLDPCPYHPAYTFHVRASRTGFVLELEVVRRSTGQRYVFPYSSGEILDLLTELECWDSGVYDRPAPSERG